MGKEQQESFTVIELLIVIAIIALLAAIILISVNGAKERARLVNIISFSSQVNHALGAYQSGQWDFDEGVPNTCASGKDVCDTTMQDNDGELTTEADFYDNYTIKQLGNQYKKNGYFDGSRWIVVDDNEDLSGMEEITIQLWIKVDVDIICAGAISETVSMLVKKNNSYYLNFGCNEGAADPRIIIFEIVPVGSSTLTLYSSSGVLDDNKWHHVVATYNNGEMKIWIDAKENSVKSAGTSNRLRETSDSLKIGGSGTGQPFKGYLDEVHIYNEGLD